MKQTQHISPPPWRHMAGIARRARRISASICLEDDCTRIELSDGRATVIEKTVRMSRDVVLASAVQWARRHGATSISVKF